MLGQLVRNLILPMQSSNYLLSFPFLSLLSSSSPLLTLFSGPFIRHGYAFPNSAAKFGRKFDRDREYYGVHSGLDFDSGVHFQ